MIKEDRRKAALADSIVDHLKYYFYHHRAIDVKHVEHVHIVDQVIQVLEDHGAKLPERVRTEY